MKRYKIQELNALEREMRAVARGERSPPADAANRRPILDEDYRGNSPDPHRQRPPRRTRRDREALGRLHRHSRRRQARRPCDVETYEERRWPIRSRRRFDPVDVLHYAIEELGYTQAELADILGSRSRASEVLARRRPLTLEMIQKINASWKIPADLLVQPYRLAATAA
jgi:HTH-type transcriptional regulator/antitoxin HigA